jgi:hypothetical protein
MISTPRPASFRANSTNPRLSETLMSALLIFFNDCSCTLIS